MNKYIIKLLQFEEGFKSDPYIDTMGYPTVGTGHRIGPKGADLANYQFFITKEVDAVWLSGIVEMNERTLTQQYDWYSKLNDARQAVILSMCYQMGIEGFSNFTGTIKLIKKGYYAKAATEMMDSLWAKQTTARATRQAKVMSTGDFESVYAELIK